MDSQMAVAVGGYGHERPSSIDLRDAVASPSSERLLPKHGMRDPVTLDPDLPLEVLFPSLPSPPSRCVRAARLAPCA